MKKLILISLVLFSFAYGGSCSAERDEYKSALKCYQTLSNGISCIPRIYPPRMIRTLEEAREWIERARINLEICLADS